MADLVAPKHRVGCVQVALGHVLSELHGQSQWFIDGSGDGQAKANAQENASDGNAEEDIAARPVGVLDFVGQTDVRFQFCGCLPCEGLRLWRLFPRAKKSHGQGSGFLVGGEGFTLVDFYKFGERGAVVLPEPVYFFEALLALVCQNNGVALL